VGLHEIFQEIVYEYPLREAIADGWLRDLRIYEVQTDEDLDAVHTSHGEFRDDELAAACNTPERNRLVVETALALCEDRKILAFSCDVQHSKDLSNAFRDYGIEAEPVWGAMGQEGRRAAIARFRAGRTRVVTNCAVLTEGFDEPSIGAVLLTRPCRTSGIVAQMVGRGVRLYPPLSDTIIIDYHGMCRRHKLATAASLMGLSFEELDGRVTREITGDKQVQERRHEAQIAAYMAEPMKARLRQIDPWSGSVISLRDYRPGRESWQAHDASDGQREVLAKRGMEDSILGVLTKGEASHLIDQVATIEGWRQDDAWEAQEAEKPAPASQEASELRKAIQRLSVRRDRIQRRELGSTNREAFRLFGKPRDRMTVEELREVYAWVEGGHNVAAG
jgi:superfamily II DNA or RNA helicase